MKFVLLLWLVGTFMLVSVNCSTARVRYANSMPQFGSATVYAFPPLSTLFSKVPGNAISNYANLTFTNIQPYFVFTTTYPTNVTALSFPYSLSNNQFYSIYTFQTAGKQLLNGLLVDSSSSSNDSVAYLRTMNLLQFDFPIDVFNISNSALLFSNVPYGNVTAYKAVPPGDYVLYWEAGANKRKRQFGNVTLDPHLVGGKAYTHWVLPTGSFIVQDGVFSPTLAKRSEAKKDSNIDSGRTVNDVPLEIRREIDVQSGGEKVMRRSKKYASRKSRGGNIPDAKAKA